MLAGAVPLASHTLCAKDAALFTLPFKACKDATRACVSSPMNRGTAKAAKIPRMTITTTSSMSVKPRAALDMDLLQKIRLRTQLFYSGYRPPEIDPVGATMRFVRGITSMRRRAVIEITSRVDVQGTKDV
jgi:hypothetical protein